MHAWSDGTEDAGQGSSVVRWTDVEARLEEDAGRRFGLQVLDVRADDRHVPGTASLPVPADMDWADALPAGELGERRHPLWVLAETPERAAVASAHLRARGWDAHPCADPTPASVLRPGSSPGRLWRPDPFLERLVPSLPPPDAGPVLDLGAGNGRDACFLASLGYRCHLVDRLPDALELAHARAKRMGLSLTTQVANLQEPVDVGEGYAVVLSIRFLERGALLRLTERVVPGGVVVLHTFGSSPHAGEPGRVRRRFRLDPDELGALFPAPAWAPEEGPHREERRGETWIAAAVRRVADA